MVKPGSSRQTLALQDVRFPRSGTTQIDPLREYTALRVPPQTLTLSRPELAKLVWPWSGRLGWVVKDLIALPAAVRPGESSSLIADRLLLKLSQ